ncbi:hypothetical protein [Clostridium botulinum]|uniref:hypothetical protein n=1 Tax=Clostridium botulinum TaxID=1491 RepID=UPI000773BDE9|nr:hypothetical protein [Clostridium botulinum]MBN3402922.1 hypothetical protein [Clostridium botulinum]MBN3447569.1 hypothetical protein [Clostridium botulinum]QDY27123.1 hypothetical protein CGQ40_20680 [Clostridium botulinum]
MNYISAENFLKQPKEIQEVFLNWWQPEFGDLFIEDYWDIDSIINIVGCVPINKKHFEDYEGKIHYKTDLVIPLLTEERLRRFIENKTNSKIIYDYLDTIGGYSIGLVLNKNSPTQNVKWFEDCGDNLLQAYWQVACIISQEEVINENQNIISINEYGLPVIKGGGKTMREMYNDEYR